MSPSRAARPAVRRCARCQQILTGQNRNGWYFERPVTAEKAAAGRFSEQVYECDGEPHDVRVETPEPKVADD